MEKEDYEIAYYHLKAGTENHRFKVLIDWVKQEFFIDVIHIIYDTVGPDKRPRLNFVLPTTNEMVRFRDEVGQNTACKIIPFYQEKFRDILSVKVEDVFVIVTSFESANRGKLYAEGTHELPFIRKEHEDIWEVQSYNGIYFFFFFTEAQKSSNEHLREQFRQRIHDRIKTKDEFNYVDEKFVRIVLDSKENFDEKYNGSWRWYFN